MPVNSRSEDCARIDELLAAKDELLREHMAERLSPTTRSRSVSPPVSPHLSRVPNFSVADTDSAPNAAVTAAVLPTSPLGINSFRSPPPSQDIDAGDTIDDIIDALGHVSRQTKLNEDMGVPMPRREPPQIARTGYILCVKRIHCTAKA